VPASTKALSQDYRGGRAIAADIVGFCRHFFDYLRAHIFKLVFEVISLAIETPSLVIVGLP
jgi:hypothetical protein